MTNIQIKNNITRITKAIISESYLLLIIITLISCTGETKKSKKQEITQFDTLAKEITSKKDSNTVQVVKENINQLTVRPQKDSIEIDFNKIYEQSEVIRATCSLNDSQVIDFLCKNFKYPNIEPINKKGDVSLTIERDGTVSDVAIINSIHPEIDKEFIRIFKTFPKFIPGKINGIAVRSKYITRIRASTN